MAYSGASSSSSLGPPHVRLDSEPSPLAASPPRDFIRSGIIFVLIEGIRRWAVNVTDIGLVTLARDPLNPSDPNAIKVLNPRARLIGYLEPPGAAILSPLIDSGLIAVEGIMDQPCFFMERQRHACHVNVFTHPDSIETVRMLIQQGGVYVFYSRSAYFFADVEAFILKLKKRAESSINFDQIFASAGHCHGPKIVEPPKDVITTELLLHQKEGLSWLIQRENSCILPPFWESRDAAAGLIYVNVLTNSQTMERPEPLQGGIFADDMGLGKTLTLLSLIAANTPGSSVLVPPFSNDYVVEDDRLEILLNHEEKQVIDPQRSNSQPEKSGNGRRRSLRKHKIDYVNHDTAQGGVKKLKIDEEEITIHDCKRSPVEKSQKIAGSSRLPGNRKTNDKSGGDSEPKTTLIVCPPSVLSTWVSQIKEHTRPGALKVYEYHGLLRTTDVQELQTFDIVLTTYNILSAESRLQESPINKIEWWRIILDEAHVIKNVNAQHSKAVMGLKSKRRWAVTGTPIQNGLFDLFSIMVFLRFEPFSIKSYWLSLVQCPITEGKAGGLSLLQALMRKITLRRTKYLQIGSKSLVELPPKTVETCFVDLSPEEREQYDLMETNARMLLKGLIRNNSAMRNYSTIFRIILRLRQICNCVELCPSDMRPLCPSSCLGDISKNPKLLDKMTSILLGGDDVECAVCISPPTEAIITSCAHIFCRCCILKALQGRNSDCPVCRNPLSKSNLFPAPLLSSNDYVPCVSASAKVSMLLKFLVSCREESSCTKSVIFSEFKKMLNLLEEPLKAAGFGFLRLDGSMTAKKRAQVIEEFGDCGPGSPTVLLASITAAGLGINLTAASRVYLFEPSWNPAVEEQAIGRLHQIGQKEAVKVVRLIAENSIEERILEFQERKKDLARVTFFKKGSKELRRTRMKELRTIMSY